MNNFITGKDIGSEDFKDYALAFEVSDSLTPGTYYITDYEYKLDDVNGNKLLILFPHMRHPEEVVFNESMNMNNTKFSRKIITGGKSFNEAVQAMKLKDTFTIKPEADKCLYVIANKNELHEDDDMSKYNDMLFDGEPGGMIVFSTDVNSTTLSDNKFKDFILKKYKTLKNRLTAKKVLDKIRRKNDIYAWTIGKYFQGVYTGDNGKTFTENSIVVDVIGITQKQLFELAEQFCEAFNQESVLVKFQNNVWFIRSTK